VVYGTVAGTGTAVAGSDYTFTKGTLNWAENDSTPRTISVPVSKVTAFSGTKSFTVQLWAPSAGLAVATPGNATAEIIGDKSQSAGTLQFTEGTYTVAQNAGTLTVGVTRAGGASGAVSAKYATATDTATGTSFTAEAHTLQWSDGDTSTKTFSIPISNATPFSGTKEFEILLSDATGGAILGTPEKASVTITGDESLPAGNLEFSATGYVVNEAAGSVVVTVKRVNGSHGAIAASYATDDSTASAPGNYTKATGTLQWSDGDAAPKTFSVDISNASPFSGTKAFSVLLSDPTGGATIINPGTATVSISGDAPSGTIALATPSTSVPQTAGSATLTVNRSGGSDGEVAVSYSTSNGTAAAGVQYTSTSGTLTWASGDESPKTLAVPLSDATPFAGDKSFVLSLAGASGGASMGTPSSTTVNIVGSAAAAAGSPQLSQSSYTVLQSAGSLSVTVNRSGGSSGAFSVTYATSDGSAIAGINYTSTSGTLQWQSGDATSKSFTVPVSNTSPFNGTKTFHVALSAPTNGIVLGTPSSATVTVTGDGSSGGAGPGVPANLLMTGQTTNSISLSWSPGSAGPAPVASYRIYRNGSLHATVTGTTYTDASANNATVPTFTAPATIYSYAVTSVDSLGNESAMAYPSVYFYRDGVSSQTDSDYSYGIEENWQSTAGNPQGGTYDVSLTYPNGGGFQPYTVPPLAPVYDLELGSFKYLTLDVKVSDTSHPFFIAHISRLPPGDVYPRAWVYLSSYCTPVVGQWVTCKVPLSALSLGYTNFTASLSGSQLTVTSIQSGVGVDAGGFISGPGIPAGTYIVGTPGGVTFNNGQPPGNGLGTYTVAGPGISGSTNVPSESMVEQRTALYKVNLGMHDQPSSTTIYVNNLGWTTN
jgi:hypothetical protein